MEGNSFSTKTTPPRLALHQANQCILHSSPGGKHHPPLKDTRHQRAHHNPPVSNPKSNLWRGRCFLDPATYCTFTLGMSYRGGWDAGEPRSPHHRCTGPNGMVGPSGTVGPSPSAASTARPAAERAGNPQARLAGAPRSRAALAGALVRRA